MTHWRLYCHLVWTTRNRDPIIDPARARSIEMTTTAICREEGVIVHAIGIVPDHLHLAVSVPPRVALADLVRRLKSATSRVINNDAGGHSGESFAWQGEYGAISFGERSLPDVIDYVRNQEVHHETHDLRPYFELTDNPGARLTVPR